MALNYADFKTYILASLWRTNDTELTNNLDTIIRAANIEIRKKTHDWQRRQKTVIIEPETQDFNLASNVSDFETVLSLTSNNPDSYYQEKGKTFTATRLARIYELRAKNPDGPMLPFYATDDDDGVRYLRLVGPTLSASNAGDLTLVYRRTIPDYETADASWLEDEQLDFYQATIFKHCALFVREDDRVTLYDAMARAAFDDADEEDKHSLHFGGAPLQMRPHRKVP